MPRAGPVNLEADLEMHLSPDGYIGVNRINAGEVNVCGLFRAREGDRQPGSKLDWLRGEAGSLLRERLGAAEFEPDSFCSVAGLQLKPERATAKKECCIGDALTMTPPVTGNGMSMAFESAEMAVEPLAAYSEGRISWISARQQISPALRRGLCAPAGVGAAVAVDDDFARAARPAGGGVAALRLAVAADVRADAVVLEGKNPRRKNQNRRFKLKSDLQMEPMVAYYK